jgi:hypothetical protein
MMDVLRRCTPAVYRQAALTRPVVSGNVGSLHWETALGQALLFWGAWSAARPTPFANRLLMVIGPFWELQIEAPALRFEQRSFRSRRRGGDEGESEVPTLHASHDHALSTPAGICSHPGGRQCCTPVPGHLLLRTAPARSTKADAPGRLFMAQPRRLRQPERAHLPSAVSLVCQDYFRAQGLMKDSLEPAGICKT